MFGNEYKVLYPNEYLPNAGKISSDRQELSVKVEELHAF